MLARAAAHLRSSLVAGMLIGLTVLAATPPGSGAPPPAPLRILLVSHSWADADFTLADDAWFGLNRLKAALGDRRVTLAWIPLYRSSDRSPAGLRTAYADALFRLRDATRRSDIVIAWGDLLTGPVLAVAPEFPLVRFGLVSSVYLPNLPPNVVEGSFRTEEEAFLAGALAGVTTGSRIVGYVGAFESHPGRIGFAAGVYYANPNVRVLADYVGYQTTSGWNGDARLGSWISEGAFEPSLHDPAKALEVALSQCDRGADVIYTAAGASDAGVFEAAVRRHRWAIGSGGQRTEGTLPADWQRRILAVISEHSEYAAYQLASGLLASGLLRPHVVWGLADTRGAPAMLDYTAHKQRFDRVRPYALALIREIQFHRVKVPSDEIQFADFVREFPR